MKFSLSKQNLAAVNIFSNLFHNIVNKKIFVYLLLLSVGFCNISQLVNKEFKTTISLFNFICLIFITVINDKKSRF